MVFDSPQSRQDAEATSLAFFGALNIYRNALYMENIIDYDSFKLEDSSID
jgi:hypothetical protein